MSIKRIKLFSGWLYLLVILFGLSMVPSLAFGVLTDKTGTAPKALPKHAPHPATIKPNLVTPHKLAAIKHVPFKYEDFKDPKTGAPITKDTIITLKFATPGSKKNGTTIRGEDFLKQINDLEQKHNALGYTFRNSTRKPMISAQGKIAKPTILQHNVLNTALMESQRSKARADHTKITPAMRKVNPFTKSSFAILHKPQASGVSVQAVAKATPQSATQAKSAPAPKQPWSYSKNYDQDWGDRDWFAAGLHSNMKLSADTQNTLTASGDGRATATVMNKDWDIIHISGSATAPSQGQVHGKLTASVCGEDFLNYDQSFPSSLGWHDDQSISVDESVSFTYVIVVIPVTMQLGFRGSAGVWYGFDLAPLKAKAVFAPHIDTKAYAQVAVDLLLVEGGVGGELTLLNDTLSIGAEVGVALTPGAAPVALNAYPSLYAVYYIENNVNLLSGDIYAFVEINYLFGSDTYSWDIYTWDGFSADAMLVNEVFQQSLVTGQASIGAPPPAPPPESHRIDQPNVKQRDTAYPQVQFRAGDQVSIQAGGCVQTGGHGKTWKRYVNPSGSNSNRLYYGMIGIPGINGGQLKPLRDYCTGASLKGDVCTVSIPGIASAGPLHLGYMDDGYGDNGYWGHDDGTENQCKNVGNAWIIINIKHKQ